MRKSCVNTHPLQRTPHYFMQRNLQKNDTHSTLKALRRQASGEATGVGALAVVVVNLHAGGSDHRVALHGPEQQ